MAAEITLDRPQLRNELTTFGPHKQYSAVLAMPLLSSLLLWLCYYPADWGWLGWVALVPFLTLVRMQASSRRIYLISFLAGLLFFIPSLQWMRVADYRMYATWIGLATFCALYFPLAILLLRRLDRLPFLPLILSTPLVWTALEFMRTHFLTGFPWYCLAHSQHQYLPLIQIADLGGVYLVTFLMAMVNGLAFEFLFRSVRFRNLIGIGSTDKCLSTSGLAASTSLIVCMLVASAGYGFWRLSEHDFERGPRVALIQGNLDQRIRNEASESELGEAATTVLTHYRDLTDLAVRQPVLPDLIVWPETSYPKEWVEVSAELAPNSVPAVWKMGVADCRDLREFATRRWPTNLLLGMTCEFLNNEGHSDRYNSAVYLTANGAYGGRYDKIHRVPFGEYVPLRKELPFMNVLAPYDFDYSIQSGQQLTHFALGKYRFGVLICYEDTYPDLGIRYVSTRQPDRPVDFLLNISNDGWFNGTSEHEQHLAICRFRAIECRRAVARAVNMGISAVIDGNGKVVAMPAPSWAESKKIPAVVAANIPIDNRKSLYADLGDWLCWTCWAVVVGGLAWGFLPGSSFRATAA
jgi:apolipoprotein N-acyltransferase